MLILLVYSRGLSGRPLDFFGVLCHLCWAFLFVPEGFPVTGRILRPLDSFGVFFLYVDLSCNKKDLHEVFNNSYVLF